jgi:hypothetical protein
LEKFKTIAKLAILLASVSTAAPAHAVTGADVTDRMNKDQRNGFLFGALEMAAFQDQLAGRNERARCILGIFGRENDPLLLDNALSHYKDRSAMPVIHLVIKQECGE